MTTPGPFWREISRDGGYAQVEVDAHDYEKVVVTVPVRVLDSDDPSDAIRLIVDHRRTTIDDLRAAQ
jgi:hypothetical protein